VFCPFSPQAVPILCLCRSEIYRRTEKLYSCSFESNGAGEEYSSGLTVRYNVKGMRRRDILVIGRMTKDLTELPGKEKW